MSSFRHVAGRSVPPEERAFPNMTSAGLTVVGTSAFYAYAHSCMHVALSVAAVATWWALINGMSYAERSQRCEEQLWLLLLLPLLALGFNDPVAAVNMAFLLQ